MQLQTLLANIANYTSDAIVITDADWQQQGGPKIVYVNDAYTALTGFRREEVIGQSPRMLQGPETDRETTQRISRALQQHQPIVAELLNYTKKKHKYWVEISLAPVFNDAGECVYYLAIEKDITERRVMQEATEKQSMEFLFSETRARAILNSIVDGIITVDGKGCIERFSPSAERLFGMDGYEAEGREVASLFLSPGDAEMQAILAAKMQHPHDAGTLSTHTLMAKRADGSQFHAEISCSTMLLGADKLLVCAVRDVTQIRQAVEEMRHARDVAEAASRAKSEFLANMSHELRTPMNGILGLSAILKDTVLDTEQRECVEALSGSASSLLTILNDILDFSKIEAGELRIEPKPFSLHDMMHHVRDFMAPMASQKGITLEFMQSPDCVEYLKGDVHRLQQILVNLVGNAIKFTEKGYVHVRSHCVREEAGDDVRLRIEVQDTGIGIPQEHQASIFNKFTQADGSNTRRYGGTGLGLAICSQLTTLMGGTIGLQSATGIGSCFFIEVPLEISQSHGFESRDDGNNALSVMVTDATQAHVLIVEDHAINTMLLTKLLRKMGFTQIDRAEHGAQAVQMCHATRYDLILMDCQMPILDGYEATKRIRLNELHQGHRTPIVAMTANAMQGDQQKCLEAGMDDYLSKPIDLSMLKRVLARWLHVATGVMVVPDALAHAGDMAIDLTHLRMFTDGDAEEEKTLYGIFMRNADESITRMEESLSKHDSESWRKAAHRLKGASGNLGAKSLYELCAEAEKASAHPQDAWAGYMQAISQELARVREFIHQQGGCD